MLLRRLCTSTVKRRTSRRLPSRFGWARVRAGAGIRDPLCEIGSERTSASEPRNIPHKYPNRSPGTRACARSLASGASRSRRHVAFSSQTAVAHVVCLLVIHRLAEL